MSKVRQRYLYLAIVAAICFAAGLGCFVEILKDSFYLNLDAATVANKTILSPVEWGVLGFAFIAIGLILAYVAAKKMENK